MSIDVKRAQEISARIPHNFTLGVATSSWQIEGSSSSRGKSIWDDFAETPGNVVDGATADPACDHLNHIPEDLDLISGLGANAYRFSLSWPRVIPEGTGKISRSGLGVYDRIVDGALERGLTPFATLYHWDLPSALQEKGGWLSPDSHQWFSEYAHVVGEHFADRVEHVATLNEPWVSAFLGYAAGIHAPGEQNPAASLEVFYRLMVASGHGIRALRAAGVKNPGLVLNLTTIIAEDEDIVPTSTIIDGLQNRIFLDLLANRGIPDDIVAATSSITDWSFVTSEGLAMAAEPITWLGINYYTPTRVASLSKNAGKIVGQDASVYPGVSNVSFVPRSPRTAMGWEIHAPSLTQTLLTTASRLPGVPLYVTENGAAFDDTVTETGIHDENRVDYYASHISAALDALDQGVDLRGYFAWSLFDNLEWAEGWTKRFGIIRVDAWSQIRTPKDSALFLREIFSTAR
ncbi:MAG TPA: beta-glucosidase [Microbacteriaceae bacterium]|jgi:beta-glucosidase|nr:beta-glucosidase [Microbacteriaceae bacterium]